MDIVNPWIILFLFVIIIIESTVFVLFLRRNRQATITEADIMSMVNEGHEDGNILAKEAEMIQNIFDFSDTDVKDIMTHRKNIVGIDGNTKLCDVLKIIQTNNFCRYPVFNDDLDNIVGVLHIKDVFLYLNEIDKPINEIGDLIKPIDFVPETHRIDTLFAQMQNKKKHIVVVVDEYGQVSGILSLEDILEEIVGNIEDEHDETESLIERKDDDSYLMDGSTSIEEVEEKLQIKLSNDFETLNGYLVSLLGKIPDDGTAFELVDSYCRYSIKNVSSKVIGEVVVKKI